MAALVPAVPLVLSIFSTATSLVQGLTSKNKMPKAAIADPNASRIDQELLDAERRRGRARLSQDQTLLSGAPVGAPRVTGNTPLIG